MIVDANENLAADGGGDGGLIIVNDGNGADTTNTGSANIISNSSTNQNNDANIVNDLIVGSGTGNNSASKNLGDSSITTGDANTTGTIVNSVNTNVDGIMVSEFNVNDNQTGDIILNFDNLNQNCISGCSGANTQLANTNNGDGSVNTAEANIADIDTTTQFNTANIDNNMTLASNTGNNEADKNTGGDSTITTGDANTAANVLNFANTNLAGNVVYAVVNIFGDLVGDIIMPLIEGTSCCGQPAANIANTGNGSGSINNTDLNLSSADTTNQFNTADIDNNLTLSATTGDNETSLNTGGTSSIVTGDTSVIAQVANIANLNLTGGNYWLLIVNEAGKWIGKILGSPDGANVAGSELMDIAVDDGGNISVTNSNNGADTVNNATVNETSQNTLTQTNTAKIDNNLNLSANTGGNSASKNTGGDSSITTGDASIVANIVNFVNTNITSTGRLFVTVVNVFGSWLGDFVAPGQTKDTNNDPGTGGNSDPVANNSNSNNNNSGSGSGGGSSSGGSSSTLPATTNPITRRFRAVLASTITQNDPQGDIAMAGISDSSLQETAGSKAVKVNLFFGIPVLLILLVVLRRRKTFAALYLKLRRK